MLGEKPGDCVALTLHHVSLKREGECFSSFFTVQIYFSIMKVPVLACFMSFEEGLPGCDIERENHHDCDYVNVIYSYMLKYVGSFQCMDDPLKPSSGNKAVPKPL